MGETDQKQSAMRLLAALENGGMSAADMSFLAEDLDPVLVHCIIRYLREVYPVSEAAAGAVLERVVGLTTGSKAVVAKFREGEQDPISRWFAQSYSFREFRGRGADMVDLLVDKIEG